MRLFLPLAFCVALSCALHLRLTLVQGVAAGTIGCMVSVIASLIGIILQLDTEDHNPDGLGLIGLASAVGEQLVWQRLAMKPQS